MVGITVPIDEKDLKQNLTLLVDQAKPVSCETPDEGLIIKPHPDPHFGKPLIVVTQVREAEEDGGQIKFGVLLCPNETGLCTAYNVKVEQVCFLLRYHTNDKAHVKRKSTWTAEDPKKLRKTAAGQHTSKHRPAHPSFSGLARTSRQSESEHEGNSQCPVYPSEGNVSSVSLGIQYR